LNILKRRSEIHGKFLNVMLKKEGKDQLDRSCEKGRRVTESRRRGISYIHKKIRKANSIGDTYCVGTAF